MLTALALGVRELAGLPVPPRVPALVPLAAPTWPSQQLPAPQHRRLVAQSPAASPLDQLTAQLTLVALSDTKAEAEATIPAAAREKLLTVRRFGSAPTKSGAAQTSDLPSRQGQYASLAAEYFILPLVNRFWLFLRDAATAVGSAAGRTGRGGSAALLDPLNLVKFLQTLSVLLHAARHAPHFLAVLAPETLELVVSLQTPPEETDDAVLTAQMELVLVIVTATAALDGGRMLLTLAEGAERVGQVQEWAQNVFALEERRPGGITACGRAAAGVLLNLDEILSHWRGRAGW